MIFMLFKNFQLFLLSIASSSNYNVWINIEFSSLKNRVIRFSNIIEFLVCQKLWDSKNRTALMKNDPKIRDDIAFYEMK